MRKARISSVAAGLGVAFIVLMFLWPWLRETGWLGWMYAPAVLVTLLLSDAHAPAAVVTWVATIAQSGVQVAAVIIVYALLQEVSHLRAASKHLKDARVHLEAGDMQQALVALGRGMADVNRRRRRTWFLDPLSHETPVEGATDATAHCAFAASAVKTHPEHRVVKRLFRVVERDLRASVGPQRAAELVATLRRQAHAPANAVQDSEP